VAVCLAYWQIILVPTAQVKFNLQVRGHASRQLHSNATHGVSIPRARAVVVGDVGLLRSELECVRRRLGLCLGFLVP
jgi:hypothetical protein